MNFDSPALLWLLLLVPVPLFARRDRALANAWATLVPQDRASGWLHAALRVVSVLAVAGLVLGMAGPYRPEVPVERVGRGAEVVLLLDRSRSMDQGFAGAHSARALIGTGPEALDYYATLRATEARQPKGKEARRLLAEFAAKRPQDRFGMVVFSTVPMRMLEFTQNQEVVQAAIGAGNIGRGLAETNIAMALEAGLGYFEDRPYTGSRILLLLSDGVDRVDELARERIGHLARKYRVGVYWIYIRSTGSPRLMGGQGSEAGDAVPEHVLHRFFESLQIPYRAYEADNPEALQRAIDDVNRLENLPITTLETLPRRDLSAYAYGTALACVLLLLAANLAEIRRWA